LTPFIYPFPTQFVITLIPLRKVLKLVLYWIAHGIFL
jgi:hypothetical protein